MPEMELVRPAETNITLPAETAPAFPPEPVLSPVLEVLNGEADTSTAHDPQENPSASIEIKEPTQVDQNQNPTYFQHLLSTSGSYFGICVPLHEAALEGNWNEAKRISEKFSTDISPYSFNDMLQMAITEGHQTMLHVAAGAGQTTFVENILKSGQQNDLLTLRDKKKNNAFCFAAATGHVEIAKLMVGKNQNLPTIRGSQNETPLYMAVLFGQRKMAEFLYPQTKEILKREDVKALFYKSITTGLYDIALKLLDHPANDLEVVEVAKTALHMLARTPSAFANKRTGLFERLVKSFPEMKFNCNTNSMTTQALQLVKHLRQKIIQIQGQNVAKQILTESLFQAAELGNFEFLAELVHSYPDLVHQLDGKKRTIFHIAIVHRHVNIFNLIYEMGFDMKLLSTYEDSDGNNMLHLVGTYPDPPPASIVPGAALELQRELLMFKEVEKIIQPTDREKKNLNGEKPQELFTKNHEKLRKFGEEWMKSTANSCMLVATLIATVVFTSAFTVPGGSHDKIGTPIHLNKTMFKVFVVSDATALTSSCTSILMFLSILTSRYREQDFLTSLPFKLIFGLLTLFISIVSMMVAFSSSIFLYYPYHERQNWMAMSTAFLVSIPITLYGRLEYPLLRDIFYSTFGSRN